MSDQENLRGDSKSRRDSQIAGSISALDELTRDTIEADSNPVLIVDNNLKILAANRKFQSVFHINAGEIIGESIYEIGNRQWDIPELRSSLDGVFIRKAGFTGLEVPHNFLDSGWRVISIKGEPMGGQLHDDPLALISFEGTAESGSSGEIERLKDELSQKTSEIEEVVRRQSGFIYAVSHDLQEPLRSIEGFSQAIFEDYGASLDNRGRDYLRRMVEATRKLHRLIDDLLRLSRVNQTVIKRERVDLSELVRTMASGLSESEPGRWVEFKIMEGLTAACDRDLMRIALENLLSNAWKFTEKHPRARIEFGAEEKNRRNRYYMRDDGAGFNQKYADQLFQPFRRLHAPDQFGGSGMGLAIVQQIISRHGGKVWAEGEIEKGATVYFVL